MAISYFPFDAGAGANVTEDQWRKMARHWCQTGVLADELNEFSVGESSPNAMSVDVDTGMAWIRGHYMESDAVVQKAISASDPTDPRIDRIVLRVDFAANTISVEVLAGTPAASPSAPALTQSASTWEISLAQVRVNAGASTIIDANITDERRLVVPGDNTPTGKMDDFGGASAPSGYLLCDGSAVSRITYADLFGVIGTDHGVGDGSTTFNLPDARGRVLVGKGTHADVDTLGETDGLAVGSRRPKHKHTVTDTGHDHVVTDPGHSHGVTDPTHAHGYNSLTLGSNVADANRYTFATGGAETPAIGTDAAATGISVNSASSGVGVDPATTGVTVGPQTGSEPTDGPAYLVANKIIKT